MAVITSALATPALTQQARKACHTLTMLQIKRVGPSIGCFVDAAVEVLPRGRSNLASSVVLAVESTSAGSLAFAELTVRTFVAI